MKLMANRIVPANAGRASRFQSSVPVPAWRHSASAAKREACSIAPGDYHLRKV